MCSTGGIKDLSARAAALEPILQISARDNIVASECASEPRDRSEPSKRRARARVGESEGRSPSD